MVDGDGRAALRQVRTGGAFGERVEILAGLTPDEPAPTGTTEPPPESPDTSAARVKPYLEPAP